MKQEVSINMLKIAIKFLTFISLLFVSTLSLADVATINKAQTHLRINLFTQRDLLNIDKRADRIIIKTLQKELFDELFTRLKSLDFDKRYVSSISSLEQSQGQAFGIEIKLADPSVELFSFYREREKKYVLDLWKEDNNQMKLPAPVNSATEKVSSSELPPVLKRPAPQVKQELRTTKTPRVVTNSSSSKDTIDVVNRVEAKAAPAATGEQPKMALFERDFRYGASFVWDYEPMAPRPPSVINLDRKTAEYFYPLRNTEADASEEGAHFQVSLNMYRDKKWGLMYKSIQLFEKKYPQSKFVLMNEYLKANALLRENFEKGKTEPVKMAISMYEEIAAKAEDYELRKAIYKFLVTNYFQQKDYVKTLQVSKKYYVDTNTNFDYESSHFAVEMMLASLAQLGQVDQLRELVKDKTLIKLVPAQLVLAYEMFSLLKTKQVKEVIATYEKAQAGLVKPIQPSIIYNAAEAYFRNASFESALKLYDEFIADHSMFTQSSHARLRIALCYDFLDRDFNQTMELYRNAINRSQDLDVSFEARVRYVAMRSIRPLKIDDSDREIRVFLDRDRRRSQTLTNDQRNLLWLTRLRTLIVDERYQDALTYLNTVPLASLTPAVRRVFEGDGAEIIYGIITKFYQNSEYTKAIQAWELYKDRYVSKVANDPYMNFLIGQSYIKLGLYNGFDELYQKFSATNSEKERTFPLWVKRENDQNAKELLAELQIVRNMGLGNMEAAAKKLVELAEVNKTLNKIQYYRGLIAYRQGQYDIAADSLERYLAAQDERRIYDANEVAQMMLAYTDSLYQLRRFDLFKRAAGAILADTSSFAPGHAYVKEVREKISYMLIETHVSEDKVEGYALATPLIVEFKKNYPESIYSGRVDYLLGMGYLKNQNVDEGKKVFEALIQDESVSEIIRELARGELSLLKIKERTI